MRAAAPSPKRSAAPRGGRAAHVRHRRAHARVLAPTANGSRVWTADVPAPRPSSAPRARRSRLLVLARRQTAHAATARGPGSKERCVPRAVRPRRTQLTQLADPAVPDVDLAGDARYALGISDVPYEKLVTWDDSYCDVYRVDVASGARTLSRGASRETRRVCRPAGATPPVTIRCGAPGSRCGWPTAARPGSPIRASCARRVEDDDHPAPPPPYGFGGWTPATARRSCTTVTTCGSSHRTAARRGAHGRRRPRGEAHLSRRAAAYRRARQRVRVGPPGLRAARHICCRSSTTRTKAAGFAAVASLAAQTAPHHDAAR